MGAAEEKGSCCSKYDCKQHEELERHASDRPIKLVVTMIGGETWTGREVCPHMYFEYQITRPSLSGWTCLFSKGGSHGESHDSFIHRQT